MFWRWISSLYDRLGALPVVSVAMLGCGVGRAWLGWALNAICNTSVFPVLAASEGHLVFDLGEIAGFIVLAVLGTRGGLMHRAGFVAACGPGFMVLASVAVVVGAAMGIPAPLAIAATLLGGFGYAFNLLSWLEVYGTLSVRRMLVAWSGSYMLTLGIWVLYSSMDEWAVRLVMVVLPLVCFAMLVAASRRIPENRCDCRPIGFAQVPWKYVLAITVFVVAFGAADSVTARPIFSDLSRVGMGLTEAVVLIGALGLSGRLDLSAFLTAAPIVMSAGVVASFVTMGDVPAVYVLLTASSELCLVLSYMVGCALAYRLGTSAMVVCGILAALNKLALQVSKTACAMILDVCGQDSAARWVLCAVTVAATVTAAFVLARDPDLIERLNWNQAKVSPRNMGYARIVEQYALTPREASILQMVSRGLETSQIAEELFCAQSTVRVHVSNLYKKLGVHSKAELLETFKGLRD